MEDAALLIIGLATLVSGGQLFVKSASQIASTIGVSQLAIGLTVVAFGTSAPELAINVRAAIGGNSAIAFGNIVGSNIANISLVLGLCAILRPLLIQSVVVSREIPMMLLGTLAVLILGFDAPVETPGFYGGSDGLMLLLLFSIFLYYTATEIASSRGKHDLAEIVVDHVKTDPLRNLGQTSVIAIVGLGLLLLGAEISVSSAIAVAESLGIPHEIIGLTIVAAGTSLPELVTGLLATWKGQTDLAVGSIVGSNIFNLLFVLGTTAVIHPVDVPQLGGGADLIAMTALSATLVLLSRVGESRIGRPAGMGLVLAYVVFLLWRVGA